VVGRAATLAHIRGLAGWRVAVMLFLMALLVPLFAALAAMVGLLLFGASFFLLMGGLMIARLVVSL
jgi:hypothetical protein